MAYNKYTRHISISYPKLMEICKNYESWQFTRARRHPEEQAAMAVPNEIAVPMGCFCTESVWRPDCEEANAINSRTGSLIEFRSISNCDKDVAIFKPNCRFENLILLQFNLKDDYIYLYDLKVNSEMLKKAATVDGELVYDTFQKNEDAKLSLYDVFLKGQKVRPNILFDIKKRKTIRF